MKEYCQEKNKIEPNLIKFIYRKYQEQRNTLNHTTKISEAKLGLSETL